MNDTIPASLQITTATTLDEVEQLRPAWERLQHHPNTDLDFYLMILRSRPEIIGPYVVQVRSNSVPVALFVCRIEMSAVRCRIGYYRLADPKLRVLTLVHGGIMGELTPAIDRAVAEHLGEALRRGVADVAFLSHMPAASSFAAVAHSRAAGVRRDLTRDVNLHWRMSLPSSSEAFFDRLSPRRRHELRRKIRQVEKLHNGAVEVRCHREPADVPILLSDMAAISQNTYQTAMGIGFSLNDENRERLQLAARRGWLRGYVLYFEQKPCAYCVGTRYGRTLHLDFMSYEPAYHREDPGTILFVRLVESLCSNPSKEVEVIDFGFGDSAFKQRFCDQQDADASFYLYAPTWTGLRIYLLRTLSRLIDAGARRISRTFALESRVKTWWRTRFRDAQGSEASAKCTSAAEPPAPVRK